MGKTELFCVLLTIFLPLTATEVTAVEGSPEPTTAISSPIYPAKTAVAAAVEVVTPASTPQIPTMQNLMTSSEDFTTYLPKIAQTSPNEMSTHLPERSSLLQTTKVQKAEMLTSPINGAQTESSTMILTTPPGDIGSTQTDMMKSESPKVLVPTMSVTTRSIPTAKLSATTQTLPTVQDMSNSAKSTELAKTSNVVPTVNLSTPSAGPNVQTTTTKRPQTKPMTTSHETTETKKSVKHGKIVAALIGSALILMMIGFLVILYKRHKLKKHQIATTDWAGPTPFLETGADGRDGGPVTLRSTNRISLTSFLPQRLSKRLSLLGEMTEEEELRDVQEMTAGSTFVGKEEKTPTKSEQKSIKEVSESNSESSGKTETALIDETKESTGETDAAKPNGQTAMKDVEDGPLENGSVQPVPKEDAPMETSSENKEQTEKNGTDNVV